MKKSGGALASSDKGAQDLTKIEGSLTAVADIWSRPTSVGIDCGAGAESCGVRKILLTHDQRLLQIFGRGLCRFGIFGLGSMSVEDIDEPDRIPGAGMPCGRLDMRRKPVDGADNIF